MVSANTASCESQCYKKSDGSQDARRESPDMKKIGFDFHFPFPGAPVADTLSIFINILNRSEVLT